MQTAVDIGCGSGRDVLFLARHGVPAHGLDYFPRDFRQAERRAERRGLDASVRVVNLTELRSVLRAGTWLAARARPAVGARAPRRRGDRPARAGRTCSGSPGW